MADYSEIGSIIADMKRQAIDAFMGDQFWLPDIEYNDRYALWGFIPSWYRRPDESGEGGGARIGPGSDSLEGSFDTIRTRIDNATKKWVGLPAANGASDTVAAASSVALQFGAASGGGTAVTSGEAIDAATFIGTTVDQHMRGSFKTPFMDKYSAQVKIALECNGCAAAILHTAYAVESALWDDARQDAVNICDSARNAFAERASESREAVFAIALTVVTAAAAIITTIASAGTAAVIVTMAGLATAAVAATSEVTDTFDMSSESYESIMTQLETAAAGLNSAIATQEAQVSTMVSETTALITTSADREDFDLDYYTFKRDLLFDTQVAIAREDVNTVQLKMDKVYDALQAASDSLAFIPDDSFVRRDSALVGIGSTGAYINIVALHEALRAAMQSTRDEVQVGKELLQLVYDDFAAVESASSESIAALELKLDEEGAIT